MTKTAFTFAINGVLVEIEHIWAHLKKPVGKDYPTYYIKVPYNIAHIVFGTEKPDALSWADYVLGRISEFGTFMVDGYVTSLTRLVRKTRGPFEWVMITVDDVGEEPGLIYLTGKAELFNRKSELPELKPLR